MNEAAPPEGLRRLDEVIDAGAEEALVAAFEGAPVAWERPVLRKGLPAARREMLGFGWAYVTDGREVTRAEEMPPAVREALAGCTRAAGLDAAAFNQAIVTRYTPGAGINWHTDAPIFGETVLTLSLACDWRMDLRPKPRARTAAPPTEAIVRVPLPRRSVLVLAGESRWRWQHRIPPVRALRYSVSFRTVDAAARASS